jgi:aspartyl-tRNA(Asn)/glutamyl-tRNA(Gln) amidotransferase subunit A
MDLTSLALSQAAEQIAARLLSPVELAAACLERIATVDRQLNAFITVTGDQAREQAQVAADEIGRGDYRGLLHGIPIALKDLYDTRGVRTTAGSSFFADRVPESDALTVEKLTAAGAISLGKLNLHEIALGVTNDNPHFGPTRNPWDPERVPGGSSGGSAAALAAGMCFGSLGSDTGGSIRIPASLCGVVGLKPTSGRVSLRGVVPLSWTLDHAGPMARTVRDVALLLDAIAGFDPADPASVRAPADDYLEQLEEGIEGWRIGVAGTAALETVDADVASAVRDAADVLRQLGASVREVDLGVFADAARLNGLITTADAATFHRERLAEAPQRFGADVHARLSRGASYTASEYAEARHARAVLRRRFESWFSGFGGDIDILVTPTTPCAAPIRAGLDGVEAARLLTRFTSPFNLTGFPAISVPGGFTTGEPRLPIGLQLVGAPWCEARVLRAARAYERERSWFTAVSTIPLGIAGEGTARAEDSRS